VLIEKILSTHKQKIVSCKGFCELIIMKQNNNNNTNATNNNTAFLLLTYPSNIKTHSTHRIKFMFKISGLKKRVETEVMEERIEAIHLFQLQE
jgi:hypothetical protein